MSGGRVLADLTVPPLTRQQQTAAALYVAAHAHDARDCLLILQALGLVTA